MRIMKSDMEKVKKILEKVKYPVHDQEHMSYAFLPIDPEYSKEVGGLEISVKGPTQGSKVVPGLVMVPSDEKPNAIAMLGFADLTFCPSVEPAIFFSLINAKLDKRDAALLGSYEMFFVKQEYMSTIIDIFH